MVILCPKCQNEITLVGSLNRIVGKGRLTQFYEVLDLFRCLECKCMFYRMVDSWPIRNL
jgi:hypothetical protein